jgi:hypothetical protein
MQAHRLLAQARTLYDNDDLPFAHLAQTQAWRSGFVSGAEWMREVLSHLRRQPLQQVPIAYQRLGLLKYGAASIGALLYVSVFVSLGWWLLIPGSVLVFYAIEAQMVFLFPLAIDGHRQVFLTSWRWTRLAGGTWCVMNTVLCLAALMLFGGWFGQGFVRSWALGCLAVVLWYEELRCADIRIT